MIPILYNNNETAFANNGLGRLRDCISCVVTEERNGIYECDFEYPVNGVNFDRIQCGCIIAVMHDEGGDIQPFDIVGYTKPIDGIVTFHCVHISYRQTAITVNGSNINSLADALTMLRTTTPANPFQYWTDKTDTGFMAAADGVPHSVRTILGGMEGSVLDSYGGEYEWDRWVVKLWKNRGNVKGFTIRYGLNLTDYNEEVDFSDTYTSVIPYWKGQDNKAEVVVQGGKVSASYPPFTATERCIPLDLTDKFETKPTTTQLQTEATNYLNANHPYLPAQSIEVDFVRITDSNEYGQFESLQKCRLCDIINVEFPSYGMSGQFKVVKTEYDVLMERYKKLELGTLATTLSEALGIQQESASRLGGGGGTDPEAVIVETGTNNSWYYHKYDDNTYNAWQCVSLNVARNTAMGNLYRSAEQTINLPSFAKANTYYEISGASNGGDFVIGNTMTTTSPQAYKYYLARGNTATASARRVMFTLHGEY